MGGGGKKVATAAGNIAFVFYTLLGGFQFRVEVKTKQLMFADKSLFIYYLFFFFTFYNKN